jgi:hypothetical protein
MAAASVFLVANGLFGGAAHATANAWVFSDEFKFTATLIPGMKPGVFSFQTTSCSATSDGDPRPVPSFPCVGISAIRALPGGVATGTARFEQYLDGTVNFSFRLAGPTAGTTARKMTGSGLEVDPTESMPPIQVNVASIVGTMDVVPQTTGGPVVTGDFFVYEPPTAP